MQDKFVVLAPAEAIAGLDTAVQNRFFEIVGLGEAGLSFDPRTGPLKGRLCIGLATWDPAAAPRLEAARKKLAVIQPFAPEVEILKGPASNAGLAEVAGRGLAWLAARQAALITQLSRDLGALRRQHEDAQNHFAAMEAFVTHARIQKYEEVFVNEADGDAVLEGPRRAGGWARLSQLLPVSSLNFCAISLRLSRSGPSYDETPVQLRIVTPEDGRVLVQWTVAAGQLAKGWNRFGLPHARGGLARSMRLEIEARTPPQFSLGDEMPLPAYQLRDGDSGAPVAERALAMRIMAALPGARVIHDKDTFLPDEAQDADLLLRPEAGETALGAAILGSARPIALNGEAREHDDVRMEADASLLCRPGYGGPTVALIDADSLQGFSRISCNVLLDHAASAPVEFRLGWVAESTLVSPDLILADLAFSRTDCCGSDWLRVGPHEEIRLEARAADPLAGGGAIFLATRMADPGESPEHALAKFRRLTVFGGDELETGRDGGGA